MAISAYDKDTGEFLATLTEQDLQCLIDALEEETTSDQDYYIDLEVIDVLEEAGASSSLLSLLKNALGDREGFEIRWERKRDLARIRCRLTTRSSRRSNAVLPSAVGLTAAQLNAGVSHRNGIAAQPYAGDRGGGRRRSFRYDSCASRQRWAPGRSLKAYRNREAAHDRRRLLR